LVTLLLLSMVTATGEVVVMLPVEVMLISSAVPALMVEVLTG
jgi:hypothetical protein